MRSSVCKKCHLLFEYKRDGHGGERRFCSRECYKADLPEKKQVVCPGCGELTTNPVFCSRSCAAKVNNSLAPKRKKSPKPPRPPRERDTSSPRKRRETRRYPCAGCSGLTWKKGATCRKCINADNGARYLEELARGDSACSAPSGRIRPTHRQAFLHLYDYTCFDCGWREFHPVDGKPGVQLEHIDGDSSNQTFTNLKLLCPNCHWKTPTYGARNHGNGLKWRRDWHANASTPAPTAN